MPTRAMLNDPLDGDVAVVTHRHSSTASTLQVGAPSMFAVAERCRSAQHFPRAMASHELRGPSIPSAFPPDRYRLEIITSSERQGLRVSEARGRTSASTTCATPKPAGDEGPALKGEDQEILGHREFTMTLRYGHLNPDRLRDAVATLEGFGTKSARGAKIENAGSVNADAPVAQVDRAAVS